jgi:hypothetical protein
MRVHIIFFILLLRRSIVGVAAALVKCLKQIGKHESCGTRSLIRLMLTNQFWLCNSLKRFIWSTHRIVPFMILLKTQIMILRRKISRVVWGMQVITSRICCILKAGFILHMLIVLRCSAKGLSLLRVDLEAPCTSVCIIFHNQSLWLLWFIFKFQISIC